MDNDLSFKSEFFAKPAKAPVSRRGFLVTLCAAGAAFGFPLDAMASMDPATKGGVPADAVGATFEPTIWYWIDTTGNVRVHVKQTEMGQHIGSAIARVVADELGADWAKVSVEHVDSDPKWGVMVTGGSTSVPGAWFTYRQAGAAGRIALAEKAAEMLGVDAKTVKIVNGVATSGDKSAPIGDLVKAGLTRKFTDEELAKMPLKANDEFTLIGKPMTALDIPNKTVGKTVYGIDAKMEGMVHAVPIIPPTRYDSKVKSIDDSAAKEIKGYQQTLKLDDPSGNVPGFAMVIASSHWAALKAAEKIKVDYEIGPSAKVSEKDMQDSVRANVADAAKGTLLDTGDHNVDPVFAKAADKLEAEYTTGTVLHLQLEPVNALVFRDDKGVWHVHCGNQFQTQGVVWLQQALGAKDGEVVMHSYMVGGGFGRRLNSDYTIPVALASKMLDGKPVKMVMPRESDVLFDSARSPSLQVCRMAFDADKNVLAMDTAVAAGWPSDVLVPGSGLVDGLNGKFDGDAIFGADHWYAIQPQRLRAVRNELADKTYRAGWLRAVGPGFTTWAIESFIDEAARKAGKDPVQFRLDLLKAEGRNAGSAPMAVGGAARQANVLKRVAELSGYGKAQLPADTAIGVATSFGQSRSLPTWVGGAAQVHVDRKTGEIDVQKIWIVVDCGTVIDPDGSVAQCEGSALWGLSMALFEGTEFENGQVKDHNLDSYTPLRMEDTPEVIVEMIQSAEAPVGLGEPGATITAPAIANAIEAAVGVRLRHLPMTAQAVLDGLKAKG